MMYIPTYGEVYSVVFFFWFGLLMQITSMGFLIYYFFLNDALWVMYVLTAFVFWDFVTAIISGKLNPGGFLTYIVLSVIGAFFTVPWWHGAVLANSIFNFFAAIISYVMIFTVGRKMQKEESI